MGVIRLVDQRCLGLQLSYSRASQLIEKQEGPKVEAELHLAHPPGGLDLRRINPDPAGWGLPDHPSAAGKGAAAPARQAAP